MTPTVEEAQPAQIKNKISPSRSEPTLRQRKPSADRSFSGESPHCSAGKSTAAASVGKPSASMSAVRKASQERISEAQTNGPGAAMASANSINPELFTYSFGKRANIMSGHEPHLPKSLLDGRRSDRLMKLKGRTYNKEDWFDDFKAAKKGEQ